MNLTKQSRKAFEQAEKNGFWPAEAVTDYEEMHVAAKLALVHSEVSEALAEGRPLPFVHDPHYVSPKEGAST